MRGDNLVLFQKELVNQIAAITGFQKNQTRETLLVFMRVVEENLESGNSISLVGFGTFEVKEQAQRCARD